MQHEHVEGDTPKKKMEALHMNGSMVNMAKNQCKMMVMIVMTIKTNMGGCMEKRGPGSPR